MKRLALLLLCACGPSQAQLDQIRSMFAAREPALAQAEQAFAAAVPNRPAPRDGGACKIAFNIADDARFANRLVTFIARHGGDGPMQASNVTFFTAKAQLDALASGAIEARRAKQQSILQRARPYDDFNGKKLVAAAEQLVAAPLDAELLIEIGATQDAKPIDSKTFQAGAIVGRAWLYAPSENRFVCAGNVIATSSESIRVWKDSQPSAYIFEIGSDLYMNMVTEAQKSLKQL
jgi:hypothetical protein